MYLLIFPFILIASLIIAVLGFKKKNRVMKLVALLLFLILCLMIVMLGNALTNM